MSPEWGRVSQAEIDAAVAVETAARAAAVTAEQVARDAAIAVHAALVNPHIAEVLANLLQRSRVKNVDMASGWTTAVTVGGQTSTGNSMYTEINTSVTANSTARLYNLWRACSGVGGQYIKPDWDKELYIFLLLSRLTSDAEVVGRLQIKAASTEGALGAMGLGLQIDNLALKGESYGTSLDTVDLATSLVSGAVTAITIHLTPGVSIEWYVDNVLKGTQSTSGKIPSGDAAADCYFLYSIINGATGNVNAYLGLYSLIFWQEM